MKKETHKNQNQNKNKKQIVALLVNMSEVIEENLILVNDSGELCCIVLTFDLMANLQSHNFIKIHTYKLDKDISLCVYLPPAR